MVNIILKGYFYLSIDKIGINFNFDEALSILILSFMETVLLVEFIRLLRLNPDYDFSQKFYNFISYI
jgi:hypothetical protein